MKKIFKKFGFTLAEILIVIGIIGTISIMVLPTLKNNYEEHVFESRAKATYNILQQAVALSKYSGDRYYGGDPKVFFNKYIKESIQIAKDCGEEVFCGGNIKESLDQMDIMGAISQTENTHSFSLNNSADVYIFRLPHNNAATFNINLPDNYKEDNDLIIIAFDTNGQTEPNILGLDVYITAWDGTKLVPLGHSASIQNVNKNCSVSGINIDNGIWSGTYCLQYMIDNGWKIKQELKDEFL